MNNGKKSFYKTTSLVMAVLFAAVGIIFLVLPAGVIGFFNRLSGPLGMKPAPLTGHQFFLILAVAYMYVVTGLAWSMFRHPGEKIYPLLLVQAKAASSLLSFLFFILHRPFLIYLVNGIVDGAIAVLVLVLFSRVRRVS